LEARKGLYNKRFKLIKDALNLENQIPHLLYISWALFAQGIGAQLSNFISSLELSTRTHDEIPNGAWNRWDRIPMGGLKIGGQWPLLPTKDGFLFFSR
jgi:hypothetical protein